MRWPIGLLIAVLALTSARFARRAIERGGEDVSEPFTPSPAAAPFVSLGYREAAADILFVELLSYFPEEHSTATTTANLGDSIIALDPNFHRVYELAANATTLPRKDLEQSAKLRAIGILEKGMKRFPDDWRLPYLAGQIYSQDLVTDDPAQRRVWDERATLLVESAIRKPGAPPDAAGWAAVMRTKLGEHERAAQGLREMILITSDTKQRKRMIEELAQLEERDSAALSAELEGERIKFTKLWRAERRTVPPTMYVLIGKRLEPGFDMGNLATGGRDLLESTSADEKLEPLE